MSVNSQLDVELLNLKRHAFILNQFASVGDLKLSQADANKRIPKPVQIELSLSHAVANELRMTLVTLGHLSEQPGKRSTSYAITDSGRIWLGEHQDSLPLRPASGKVNAAPDATVELARVAHLLWELVEVPDGGQTPAELNKKQASQKKKLGLNSATARHIRGTLVDRRFITVNRTPRSEKYNLTSAGLAYLVTLSFDDFGKLTLSGAALTQLLRAARDGVSPSPITSSPLPPATTSEPAALASQPPQDLESAVMQIFLELLNERHANTRLVPIHEVRSAIRQKFGTTAASHDVFDDTLFGMRRSRIVAFLSISDRSSATEQQLRDSIVGVGETFFYLLKPGDNR